MKKPNVNHILSGIMFAVSISILLVILFKLAVIISLLIGIIAGALLSAKLISLSRGERFSDVADEIINTAAKPTPYALLKKVQTQLYQLRHDIMIHKFGERKLLIEGVIHDSEGVIALFLEVFPRALEESPDSESTFDLEKMSSEYFPDLLRKYLRLSQMDQTSTQEAFLQQLKNINVYIQKAEASLDEGNFRSFKTDKNFVDMKISGL
jgi:hypothetical protein